MRKEYKAYIAAKKYTPAFDHAWGKTPESAMGAVKRRNSPDWLDCYVWAVYVDEEGREVSFS